MSQSLDLSISELEDVEDNDKELVNIINGWYKNESDRKQLRAMGWSQAIHYLAGNQWIQYNTRENRFDSIPITDRNRHLDRPVTNHFARWIKINASGYTNKPSISIEANTEDSEDKTAAKVGEIIYSYLWEHLEKDEMYYEMALWKRMTGICIRKSFKKLTNEYVEIDGKRNYFKFVDSSPVTLGS